MYSDKTLKGIYQRVVNSMSGVSGITVEVGDYTPCFEPETKKVFLPSRIAYAKNEEESFMWGRGICVHEASHVLFAPSLENSPALEKTFRRKYPIYSNNDHDKTLLEILNVFLDINNEYKVAQIWPHLGKALKDKTEALFKARPKILKSEHILLQLLMRCDRLSKINAVYPSTYSQDIINFVEEVVKQFDDENIKEADGETLIEFCIKVWEKLKDLLNLVNDQKSDLQKQAVALQKKLAEAIKKKDKEQIEKLTKERGELILQMEKCPDVLDRLTGSKTIPKHNLPVTAGDYSHLTLDQLKERLKKPSDKLSKNSYGDGWGCSDDKMIKEIKRQKIENPHEIERISDSAYKNGRAINRELKKKVKIKEGLDYNYSSGSINIDQVRRQVSQTGQINSSKIFTRDEANKGKWVVDILIDCSGSMGNTKMRDAKEALATLGYALDGLPHIKFGMTGFTTRYEQDMEWKVEWEIKTMGGVFKKKELEKLYSSSGNCDGYHIRNSIKRLQRYPHYKKLMIVISDGQPAYTNGIDDCKLAVKKANKRNINVIGIGIPGSTEKALKEMYPEVYYFGNSKNLVSELTKIILKNVNK